MTYGGARPRIPPSSKEKKNESKVMSVRIRYPVGRCWLDVEAVSVKEAIKELSEFLDVLGESQCGLCGSEHVQPRHRLAKGYDFFEMFCLACGARLDFGQTREGDHLFPKRKDQDGNWIGKNGWYQWEATQADSGGF